MADIVKFPRKPAPPPGNGALEAMRKYFVEEVAVTPITHPSGLEWPDHILMWLWNEGMKVVPVDDEGTVA